MLVVVNFLANKSRDTRVRENVTSFREGGGEPINWRVQGGNCLGIKPDGPADGCYIIMELHF